MNKIKNNKLFNKFVKNLAEGQNKVKEEPPARPVEYRIAYQASGEDKQREKEDRSTLLKPTSYGEAQSYKVEQSRGYSPASNEDEQKDTVKTTL